jgi:hypothetical protein
MSFNGISFGAFLNSRTVAHDEVRLGETWASVVASPFAQWLGGFTFAPGADKSLTGDADGDGITNLVEYAFGTNPTVSAPGAITFAGGTITSRGGPAMSVAGIPNGVDFRAVFGRRKDYLAAGLTYTVQFSADLATWVNSAAVPAIIASDAEMDAVTVPYPLFITTPRGAEKPTFFRVLVTMN